MKRLLSVVLAIWICFGFVLARSDEPTGKEIANSHRADFRRATEIQQANLSTKLFPNIDPGLSKDRNDIPVWWQSTLGERDAFIADHLKKGQVIEYGTSAGGRPLVAIAYGQPRGRQGTTNANGSMGYGDICAWLGPDHAKRVGIVFSGIHAGEFEGIVSTMNLLSVLESGKNLAGRAPPEFAAAAQRLDRLIVIPIANPDVRSAMSKWGLAKDEFVDNGHWPHQIYVREARRMIGKFVMTENELLKKRPTPDSIGMGSYTTDSHNVQRYITPEGFVQNEGDISVPTGGPYQISLGSILPKEEQIQNLVVPVCVSSSHIAFGSIRMEPVFMILGEAAAAVASIAINNKTPVQKVPYEVLRSRLIQSGQILE